jgi:type IV pilus assembly protein PilX
MNASNTRSCVDPQRRRAGGAALPIALLLLVAIAMLGITAHRIATVEERMSGNTRDRLRAFEAAETALRTCESTVIGSAPIFDVGLPGRYRLGALNSTPPWRTVDWSSASATSVLPANTLTGVAQQPRCVVEEIEVLPTVIGPAGVPITGSIIYRVTARGVGLSAATVVMLQSYVRRSGP